jgi:Carboxypeptidase regulatory-like domain
MPRWLTGISSIFLVFLLCSSVAFGQRDLGTITGTVTDPSGSAIANAKIAVTNDATGVTSQTVTTDAGVYSIPAVQPGNYSISVEAAGFQTSQQKGIAVTPGGVSTANVPLQVGNASQTVEVTAAAPLLQTESQVVGQNLSSQQVSELPLGGQRTFTFLARLSPGVLPAESGARGALGGDFSANGVRSTGENNFLLNGIDNNVNVIDFLNQTSFVIGPSVDAIGDMQVITNGASAEYGRAAGGIVDVTIKSGTNDLHGSVFEIFQNTVLDANRWENNLAGKPRNPFKQNQFGGTLGGPLIKNKLFMFGDYQGTRIATAGGSIQNLGYGGFYTVPTLAMRNGDFSSLLGGPVGTINGQTVLQNQLYDPKSTTCLSGCSSGLTPAPGARPVYTRAPYVNNQIPVGDMDPVAYKLAQLYPAPNQPVGAGGYPQNNYYTVTPGGLNTDQGDGRVDYKLNDNNSIFGSISWSDTSKTSIQPFPGPLDASNFNGVSEIDLGRNAMLSWTHIFSPTMVNEARIGFTRLVTTRSQGNANVDLYKQFGIQGYDPTTTGNGGLPQFGLGRYSQVGANDWLPTKEYNNEWDFIENLSIVKGSHSIRVGAEWRSLRFPFFQFPFPHGEMNFSRTETSYPSLLSDVAGSNGTFTSDTGDEMASFLLGAINNGQISTTNFISSTRQAYAGYVQDTWKVTPKFTLNLGVRYELFTPIGEQFSRQSNYVQDNATLYIPRGPNQDAPLPPNFSTPAVINGLTFPALFPNVKVSRGLVNQYMIPWDKTDFGPRLGFAYNIQSKTVIRGFFGMFYGGEENQGGNPNRGESAPFNLSPQLNRPAGVNQFQPDPLFAGGNPTGGIVGGYPVNVFNGFPVSSLQFRSVAPDFLNPMVQEWNLTIQRELPGQMGLSVGYLGNHSARQLLQPDPNACPNVYTTNSAITCNALRPLPEVGSVSGTASFGVGNYNALTAQLQKRMSSGLQFTAAYTYGHALANSGTTLSGASGLFNYDPLNYNKSYTNASWDIRHNVVGGFTYEVPFGRGKRYGSSMNRFLEFAVGNWQLNGLLTFHTGQPYTINASGCQLESGAEAGCGADLIGPSANQAPAGGRRPAQWFNTANIGPPSPLSQGTLGLQTNYAPPTRNADFSVFKDFPFTERFRLQFRAESFNIANTAQYSTPDSAFADCNAKNGVCTGNFGRVTSTAIGSERHIQFQLRILF